MNWGELQTHFTSVLNRRDLTPTLRDSFLRMGMARIQRELRAPFMEKSVLFEIGETYDKLPIPDDYIALVALTVEGQTTKLQRVNVDLAIKTAAQGIDKPLVFARQQQNWILGPRPALGTVIRMDFYADRPDLVELEDTNTMLVVAWDLITYAALVLAAEYYLDRRLETFEARYSTTLDALQSQADFDEISFGTMVGTYQMMDEI
jgi:hypothetical protein